MVYRTILDALGNTPLIELNHMTTPDQARIVVKYEGLNVGGSIKTRTALQMIEGAEAQGSSVPIPSSLSLPVAIKALDSRSSAR